METFTHWTSEQQAPTLDKSSRCASRSKYSYIFPTNDNFLAGKLAFISLMGLPRPWSPDNVAHQPRSLKSSMICSWRLIPTSRAEYQPYSSQPAAALQLTWNSSSPFNLHIKDTAFLARRAAFAKIWVIPDQGAAEA